MSIIIIYIKRIYFYDDLGKKNFFRTFYSKTWQHAVAFEGMCYEYQTTQGTTFALAPLQKFDLSLVIGDKRGS